MKRDSEAEPGRRVGELAAASGLTVRTMHHYEEIGLLVPARRNAAGHRMYDAGNVDRLYRICHLRRLGLPLQQVAQVLDNPAWDLSSVLSAHLESLERRLTAGARLRSRLTALLSATANDQPTQSDLLEVLEQMTMIDSDVERRISILVFSDLDAAFTHLTEVFGLGPGEIQRNDDGVAVHASIEAGDGVVWLHPESPEFGLASPRTLGAATSTMAVMVEDVDAHHTRSVSRGANIVYPPADQPYGFREYSARDPEGGFWSFMKALDQGSAP